MASIGVCQTITIPCWAGAAQAAYLGLPIRDMPLAFQGFGSPGPTSLGGLYWDDLAISQIVLSI